ncbi:hypothetical protein O181_029518 [Austropuccinia psidii MF-1]|uniref:Uncharacterized protein n=1 Tax=Austropuccinia psidii MF-1 TaxID=1389203 RepID=A0A9Q3H2T8_9BASI|nr:hypothetical protein [Austropuccinia psidii MF-1]
MEFLVFENLNQIIVVENPNISLSSKDSIPPENYRKYKGKEPEEHKLEVGDSEEIPTIKVEVKKMRKDLGMSIQNPEDWIALELSGINETHEGESPQKKCKMDPKPSE